MDYRPFRPPTNVGWVERHIGNISWPLHTITHEPGDHCTSSVFPTHRRCYGSTLWIWQGNRTSSKRVVSNMLKLKMKRISHSDCLGQSIEESKFADSMFPILCRSWDSHSIWRFWWMVVAIAMPNGKLRIWVVQFLGLFLRGIPCLISFGFPSCILSDPRNISEAIWCQKITWLWQCFRLIFLRRRRIPQLQHVGLGEDLWRGIWHLKRLRWISIH